MGLCTAHTLSRAGHNITLFDKHDLPAQNASFVAGGMLAPYSEIEHMPREWINAGLHGISQWQNITATMPPAHDTEFKRAGSLLIAHIEDQYIMERFKNHLESTDFEGLNQTQLSALEPQIAERFSNALLLTEEAHLHPQKTMRALLDACDFQFRKEETKPSAIKHNYDYVIDCRGMGAEKKDPKLRAVKGEIAIVRNEEFYLNRPVRLMHPRYPLYVVPRKGNIFMIGATMIESGNNEHVSVRSSLELLSALYSLHPSFGEAEIIEIKAGLRPSYPDNLPRIRQDGNIIRCNGLFRHGYLLAPVMAECTQYLIEGKPHEYTALFTGENNESNGQRQRQNIRSAA